MTRRTSSPVGKTYQRASVLPVTPMVWTLPDPVIEDPALLEHQFTDLCRAGFDGIAVYVRCSRYTWDDPLARNALTRISALCQGRGVRLWIGPDPRFISRLLITPGTAGSAHGAELLLFGDSTRAERIPNTAPIIDGRFELRCALRPRHAHMFHEVALEYSPMSIARCYAVRHSAGPLTDRDVYDISTDARQFFNARDGYVEAFGRVTAPLPPGSEWIALVFFHVVSSQVDYSDTDQMERYASRLKVLRAAGVEMQSLMWDEPGYTCTYGSLPYTPSIRTAFRRSTGSPLARNLWKLAFDAADGSHIPLRRTYYTIVQESVIRAQKAALRQARRLWGPGMVGSVHDTWHFESADMCDMNHGSLDLWKGAAAKGGGFVDLGGVNDLREPTSPYYAHLAALSVIAASLGRHSKGGYAYNNLWTVGDDAGEGWQRTVMDHCVNVMALFGTRWMAHAYGPVGTIGSEMSFLGSPPLPGYPDHSTWVGFRRWTARLRRHSRATCGAFPQVNLLVLFPLETMYALADVRANACAAALFSLILSLVDAQYQVDIVSTGLAARGRWRGNRFELGGNVYEAVIFPFPLALDIQVARALRLRGHASGEHRVLFFGQEPAWTINGNTVKRRAAGRTGIVGHAEAEVRPATLASAIEYVMSGLGEIGVTRPVSAPPGSWVTLTSVQQGALATVIPSRHGTHYKGSVSCPFGEVLLPDSGHLTRILFRSGRPPQVENEVWQ